MTRVKMQSVKRIITVLLAMIILVSNITVSYADTTTEATTTTESGTTAEGETTSMPDMLDQPKSDFEIIVIMFCGMAFFAAIVVLMSGFTSHKNKYDDYDDNKRNKNMF